MHFLRTPDARFHHLPDYPFAPHYVDIDGLRLHYVDENSADDLPDPRPETVLMLHGEPTWSYLYRKMIPVVAAAGYRVVAPDLIGFGKSDKPTEPGAYSYQQHVDWLTAFVEKLDLQNVTLVCQDWGGLLGLRVAAENGDRFARITASNTGLPTGDQAPSAAFTAWQTFARETPTLPVGTIVSGGCVNPLPPDVVAAYDAPFPDETYKAAARMFPSLVPTRPDDPAAPANRAAWDVLKTWQKPFLTAFSDGDPITAGGDRLLQKLIPGAQGQPHVTLTGAGHFVQEEKGDEWAERIIQFIRQK